MAPSFGLSGVSVVLSRFAGVGSCRLAGSATWKSSLRATGSLDVLEFRKLFNKYELQASRARVQSSESEAVVFFCYQLTGSKSVLVLNYI
jgi:hypothetical protein